MTAGSTLLKGYFNYIYNPVYDFAIGRLSLYRKLQERSVNILDPQDGDRILCAGLGTGNEISHILEKNKAIDITGIDYSDTALKKARTKAVASGKEIVICAMNIQDMAFPDNSFDKVLCIHVMDFIRDREKGTREILRVLKDGGRFVITYPSEIEGMKMGINILKENINSNIGLGHSRPVAVVLSVLQSLTGLVYLPLMFRSKKAMSHPDLEVLFNRELSIIPENLQIEDFYLYSDFIVTGIK